MTQPPTDIRKCFDDQRLQPTTTFLRDYKLRAHSDLYSECYESLAGMKQEAVQQGDQQIAKAIWCLETVAQVQEHYITAFQSMYSGQFEEAWRHLDRCEVAASSLAHHFPDDQQEFGVAFARTHTERFQELFPVSWGMSPELLVTDVRCSICHTRLTLRNDCGHQLNEIYDGEQCHKVVEKFEVLAVSLVENPVQKSTVIFPENLERLYPIQHIAENLRSPWQAWDYHKEERRQHHPDFKALGRNDACACGSGVKYKRCCLQKDTVFPHYQIYLLGEP